MEKVGKLAEVMKRKSKDPEVVANADKVLSATAVGQLPDREAVPLGSCGVRVDLEIRL